jgi:hypothetical protein
LAPKRCAFIKDGHLESIVINATRFVGGINKNFTNHIAILRDESDHTLKANFLAAVELKWGLNEPDRVISMSESDFFCGA